MCISRCAKVMSGESTPVITATATSKKRELTSPEFDVDFKKNKCASSSTVSISDLDLDISIEQEQENSDKSGEMASNVTPSAPSASSASASSSGAPHIVIPPTEMLKISEMLKETFRSEMVTMVDSVVAGVLKGLQDRITSLEISNKALVQENKSLVTRLEVLEKRVDQAEQYSRRNCLRISGISEEVNENTDNIVMSLASDIGSDTQQSHIDRSHRVGNPKKSSTNIAGSAIADELFLSAGKRGSKIPLKPANILYKYIHTDEIHVDVNSATTPWRMPANILYKYIHTDEIHVDVNSATTPWRMPEINT